ncbi:MAG: hypothetical protein ACJASM_000909 [Salibacteraceae bacterium]|jgi:hypothetical protein
MSQFTNIIKELEQGDFGMYTSWAKRAIINKNEEQLCFEINEQLNQSVLTASYMEEVFGKKLCDKIAKVNRRQLTTRVKPSYVIQIANDLNLKCNPFITTKVLELFNDDNSKSNETRTIINLLNSLQ